MKIALEDSDIEKIAKGVAKLIGGKPAAAKPAAAADDDFGDGDAGEGDDFGEGDGDGDGEAEPEQSDVKAALVLVSKKHGQEAAVEILRKVGKTPALSKLATDKYADVIAACKKKAAAKK